MWWLLLNLYLRKAHVGIPLLLLESLLSLLLLLNLLNNLHILVPLISNLLLINEPLLILIPLILEFLVIMVLEDRVRFTDLLEVCGFGEVLPDVVELLRLAIALLRAFLLSMLTSTYGTIKLFFFLLFDLWRFPEDLS